MSESTVGTTAATTSATSSTVFTGPNIHPGSKLDNDEKVASYFYYSDYDPATHFDYRIVYSEDGLTVDEEATAEKKGKAYEEALEYHWSFCQALPYEFKDLLQFFALPSDKLDTLNKKYFKKYQLINSGDYNATTADKNTRYILLIKGANDSVSYEIKQPGLGGETEHFYLQELSPIFLEKNEYDQYKTFGTFYDYTEHEYNTWINQQVYENSFMVLIRKPSTENQLTISKWAEGIERINEIFKFQLPVEEGLFTYSSIYNYWIDLDETDVLFGTSEDINEDTSNIADVLTAKYTISSSNSTAPHDISVYYTPLEDASVSTVYLKKTDAEARAKYLKSKDFPNNIVRFYFSEIEAEAVKGSSTIQNQVETIKQAYLPAKPTHKQTRIVYDRADYLKLYRPKNPMKFYTVTKNDFNSGIAVMNNFWTMQVPTKIGEYYYHKKTNQWLATNKLKEYIKKHNGEMETLVHWISPEGAAYISVGTTSIWERIWTWLKKQANKIGTWVKNVFGSIADFIANIFTKIKNWFGSKATLSDVEGWFKTDGNSWFKDMEDSNYGNYKSAFEKFVDKLKAQLIDKEIVWAKKLQNLCVVTSEEEEEYLYKFQSFLKSIFGQKFEISAEAYFPVVEVNDETTFSEKSQESYIKEFYSYEELITSTTTSTTASGGSSS